MNQWWPLADLCLRTPQLELRLPNETDLQALASLAVAGVHDDAVQPFAVGWTDVSPAERGRSVLQYHWAQRGAWRASKWSLDLAVLRDGVVVGTQGVSGTDFAHLREVSTGSWLGRRYHRLGIGTQMRAAVLHLAFAGLGARYALSGAFADNAASLGVSRKLGYQHDGIERIVRRGEPATSIRLRLDKDTWAASQSIPVQVDGLEPCLAFFGVQTAAAAGAG